MHDPRIQHPSLVQHISLMNARGADDEPGRRRLLGVHFPRGDGLGMLSVVALGIGVEGHDQLIIGDDLLGGENSGAGDEIKLAKFINDKDPQVQLWSVYGLEKASGTRKQNKGLSLAQRRQKWTAWASKNSRKSKNLF